jgi:hypothetical protein
MMNTIASASICLLNDFIRSLSALTNLASFVADLSPQAIKTLEGSRDGWQTARTHDFANLLLVTKLVAIGVILEGPELVFEIMNAMKRWWKKSTKEHAPDWITFVGLVGWVLVAVGVAGEFWVDGKVNTDDDNVQSINITLLRDAGASAAQARSDANDAHNLAQSAADLSGRANGSANAALLASSNAVGVAGGARKEADSFEADIVSAKTQAASAESHLADALQRAAHAEAELERIRTPRSLSNTSDLIEALKAFKGTEYTVIGCFQDQESIDLLIQIDKALAAAGWTRGKLLPQSSFGDIQLTISKDFSVPLTTRSGVLVAVQSSESAVALQGRPIFTYAPYIRAGMLLKGRLGLSISPPQDRLDTLPLGAC